MKNRYLIYFILAGIFLGFFVGNIVHAETYYYLDFDEYFDPTNNMYINDANMMDGNTATYAYTKFDEQPAYYYINETSQGTAFWGLRFWCANYVVATPSDYQMQMEYNDGSKWVELFNQTFTHSQWQYFNLTQNNVYCEPGTQKEFRFKIHYMPFRSIFRLYEIEFISVYDANPSSSSNPLCGGMSELWGSDYFGLEPPVYGLVKDGNPQNNCTIEFWIKGIDNDTWFLKDSASGGGAFCYYFEGDYFNKYGVEYEYSLNRTDDFKLGADCIEDFPDWVNTSLTFTILPYPLDNDTEILPNETGLDNADCWEMISAFNFDDSISKTDLYLYNESNDTLMTWENGLSLGLQHNSVWRWNSSTENYDNVTTLYSHKGYWVYFYDKNVTVVNDCGYNFNENRNDTVIDDTLLWVLTNINVAFQWNGTSLNVIGLHNVQNYGLNITGGTCEGIVWVNYTDGNLTFNVSLNKFNDTNTSSYQINEENWLYTGATILFDNSQFFIVLLLGIWLFFIAKYFDDKKSVIISYIIVGLSIPLSILMAVISLDFTFGFIVVFAIPVVSFIFAIDANLK